MAPQLQHAAEFMKLLLWTLCAVGLAPLGVHAQGPPDFSGIWTMDLSRSEAAAQGPAIGPVTLAIQQTPAELRIETTRNGTTETVRYLPVGMKPVSAGERVGTFRWEGLTLITDLSTHINNQAVTFQEVRSLNLDGSEMAVEVTLVVQHGYTTGSSSVVQSSKSSPNTSTGKNVFLKAR
jgi:hypothetical protein